jgi:hypothetical protein
MNTRRLLHLLLVLLLSACRLAMADSPPQQQIRAHLETSGPVVAGTQIKLVLDCLTTAWFTEAPDWPLFTVRGAIVSLPDEQAENLHEVIDGVSWFGVSRAYRVAAQTAGVLDVPSFAITLHPGGMSAPVTLSTPALKLVATVPAGAEGMRVFLPTARLTVTRKIEPAPNGLKVRDTLTRTITQTAEQAESMLIPPAEFGDIDGLKRYPQSAVARNIVRDREGLVAGERTDSVTYVIDRSGRFKLAAVTIEWWNTAARRKETIIVPAVNFSAAAAKEKPLFGIPADAMSSAAVHRIIVIDRGQVMAGFAILLLAFALVWAYPRWKGLGARARQAIVAARKRHGEGDAPAWRILRGAVHKGSTQRIIPALYRWMDKHPGFDHPARLDRMDLARDPDLQRLAHAVAAHYSNHPDPQWAPAQHVLRGLKRHARAAHRKPAALPPLNE